jgi:hypothetical protein
MQSTGENGMEPMDLLADTRRYLADAIRQLEVINAGAPIAKPLSKEQAITIVTEQIGRVAPIWRRGKCPPDVGERIAPPVHGFYGILAKAQWPRAEAALTWSKVEIYQCR